MVPDPCLERTGASHSAHLQSGRPLRLIPAAHARRWVKELLYETDSTFVE